MLHALKVKAQVSRNGSTRYLSTQRLLCGVISMDRCNTCVETLCWRLVSQRFEVFR